MNTTYNKTLIMQANTDSDNVPFRPQITQIDPITECLTVITEQTVDEMQGLEIISPTNLIQVYNEADLINSTNKYLVLHDRGQIKFSSDLKDSQILFRFYGKEAVYISDSRIFTTLSSDGTVTETLHDVIADARKALDLLKNGTDLVALDVTLNMDIENARNEADILENDIVVANQKKNELEVKINDSVTAKNNLDGSITLSITKKTALDGSITLSDTKKSALDGSIATSDTKKIALDGSITSANSSKTALDTSKANADASKVALDASKVSADTANSNLQATIDASDISGMQTNITGIMNGTKDITYSNLTTVDKTVDGALNELVTLIGTLSGLTTVNKTNLVNALNEISPVGEIKTFAMSTPPTGFLECNGTLISRTTFSRLFSKIGTTYGAGDGSTTFALPDYRGVTVRGWDHGRGLDGSRTFGSYQADDFKSHNHAQNVTAHNGNITEGVARVDWSSDNNGEILSQGANTGSTGGTETRMKNISALFCIRY